MFCLSPSLRSLRPCVRVPGPRCKRLLVAYRERSLDWDSRRSESSWSKEQGSSSSPGSSHARRDFLEARQVSLYELFDGTAFLLDVPEYQRPYAWRAKQVGQQSL